LQDIQDGTFHYATGINMGSGGAMSTLTQNLEKGPDVVHEWLQRAGVDASALDPGKSAADMEAVIRDAPRLGHIARARKYFGAIISHGNHIEGIGPSMGGLSDNPADIAKLMTAEIEKANRIDLANGGRGVDLTALDPAKSPSQMQEEVYRRIVEGYVIKAREEFYFLKIPGGNPTEVDNRMQDWLDKANAAVKEYGFRPLDASVLDAALVKSDDAVKGDILEATKAEHFEKASRVLYWSRHGGYGDSRIASEDLSKELVATNKAALALGEQPIDAQALDPTGGKYRAQLDRDLADFSANNTQALVERVSRSLAAAEKAAMQNEPALAALIRPQDTPAPQNAPQIRQKG
jgi:hypothetical protein